MREGSRKDGRKKAYPHAPGDGHRVEWKWRHKPLKSVKTAMPLARESGQAENHCGRALSVITLLPQTAGRWGAGARGGARLTLSIRPSRAGAATDDPAAASDDPVALFPDIYGEEFLGAFAGDKRSSFERGGFAHSVGRRSPRAKGIFADPGEVRRGLADFAASGDEA
jgi:hypothetical protein